ncbi:hypothetical protein BI380_07870 [Delftia tsuruhatensis]|uniref:Uncharacterized protein n=1 Tax=Delftia tsuruhatensis TaxID=180282 RepID=A0ABN4SHC0_9BURK|nr:hypothetical protein BI380_07870 [Delftia tsuruhatensis]
MHFLSNSQSLLPPLIRHCQLPQPAMPAQHAAVVFLAEQAALLQHGEDFAGERFELLDEDGGA